MVPLKAVVPFLLFSMLGLGASAQEFQIIGPSSKTVVRGVSPSAPDRVLVKLRPGKAASFRRQVQGARALPGAPDLLVVPVPKGSDAREAAQRYARRADVLYAEPDAVATVDAVPSDARWSEQWDMVKISAPAAWDVQSDSSDQVVAIVDTGIDASHPDLQANLWTDPLDGSHGVTCRNGTVTAGAVDDNGHGSHVAGIIGAVGNNAAGIAGVNWSVQLLPLKAFDRYGNANLSDIVACMNKLVELRQRGFNIRVANHSWSTATYSQALRDAFANAEAAGILQVAAAGNSTTDLDFSPAYPAAFSGRNILSVSSTNSTDGMASFTNFGHVEVDFAAPGHNILSTVPTGTCSNCDPSGYKLLSGTSMAAPHVSGVAAALFHRNPLLTPTEARDVLLDPASLDQLPYLNNYQWLSATRGGRLNFAKVLANPLATTPQLNGFPEISTLPRFVRTAGSPVTLFATSSDPDGDPLAFEWGKPLRNLLYGVAMNRALPPGNFNPSIAQTNPYTFTAPSLAITATSEYKALINDRRGGGAAASTRVTVLANPAAGQPPTGQISVTPSSATPGTWVTVSFPATDPEGGTLYWQMASSFQVICCYPTSTSMSVQLDLPGVYRFNAQAIDPEMNLSQVSSTTVRVGDAPGEAPVVQTALSATSGTAPLSVQYDASGSYDPDGGPLTYNIECEAWGNSGVIVPDPPTGTCVFTEPGPHTIGVRITDSQGYADERVYYVMATDELVPDTTAPIVQVIAPSSNAALTGSVAIEVGAADQTGVTRVEIYRDAGILLANDTTEPWGLTWNTTTVALGNHTLYALAFDQDGHVTTSAPVTVDVRESVPPTVTITSPANGATVSGQVLVTASASDNVGVARVEFFRDSTALATDTSAPWQATWNSTGAAPGAHTLAARAYDVNGNMSTLASITVNIPDTVAPSVSIVDPVHGGTVPRFTTTIVEASAADNVGVTRVEMYAGTKLLCTDYSSPYLCSWKTPKTAGTPTTLQARAYDAAGNMTSSAVVQVTTQ